MHYRMIHIIVLSLIPVACDLEPNLEDEPPDMHDMHDMADSESGGHTEAVPDELLPATEAEATVCGGPPGGCCIQPCSTCMWTCFPSSAAGDCPNGGTYRPCDGGECYHGFSNGICINSNMDKCCS